jgi:hypothetical protein
VSFAHALSFQSADDMTGAHYMSKDNRKVMMAVDKKVLPSNKKVIAAYKAPLEDKTKSKDASLSKEEIQTSFASEGDLNISKKEQVETSKETADFFESVNQKNDKNEKPIDLE